MATFGGKQPGAGRPKGSKNAKPSLPPPARLAVSQATVDAARDLGITPLIVMLEDMKLHYDTSKAAMAEADKCKEDQQEYRQALINLARSSSSDAAKSAALAAPYVHAKLQAVVVRTIDEPTEFEKALGLSTPSALRAAIRGVVLNDDD